MNIKTFIMTCGLAVCLLALPAVAGPFEDGIVAIKDGDYETALKIFRPLADEGNAGAQCNIGSIYESNVDMQNYTEAAKWYREAADQGNQCGQYGLGRIYFDGHGVPQDYAEALKWYRLAADQGEATSQSNLGFMYAKGNGVPQDYIQAHMWWNLAAASFPASGSKNRDVAEKHSDEVAAKMIPEQIAEAQRLAREWLAAHPRK